MTIAHTLRGRPRDRWTILGALATVTAVAWVYTVIESKRMTVGASMGHAMHQMVQMHQWDGADVVARLVMWAVMMVAMMVPTAVPMTLVYAAVARKAERQGTLVTPTFVFVAGYAALWILFAFAATASQWGLDRAALLSPAMASTSPVLGGAILTAAGIYQLTPLKRACLESCRAPAQFISHQWRTGPLGALRMGLHFGAYCVGCCWVLMALLFVGGVMNLVWIAAIAAFVLLEKTLPFAEVGGRIVGVAMILAGVLSVSGLFAIG